MGLETNRFGCQDFSGRVLPLAKPEKEGAVKMERGKEGGFTMTETMSSLRVRSMRRMVEKEEVERAREEVEDEGDKDEREEDEGSIIKMKEDRKEDEGKTGTKEDRKEGRIGLDFCPKS